MAKEGVRPSLLLEVTSPSTRKIDLRDKRRDYYRAGVPYYVIVDEQLRQGRRGLRILGYRRGRRGYERLSLNRQGRLWLGQEDGQVRCYDAQGHPLADYTELSHKTEAAERARAEAERARAKAEQARVAEAQARAALAQKVTELEAELRRARGNSR